MTTCVECASDLWPGEGVTCVACGEWLCDDCALIAEHDCSDMVDALPPVADEAALTRWNANIADWGSGEEGAG